MSRSQIDVVIEELSFLTGKEALALSSAKKFTVENILDHLPRRYEDRRQFDLFPTGASSEPLCLRGTVVDAQRKGFGKRGFYEAVLMAGGDTVFTSNKITLRWFNMPYVHKMLASGHEVIAYGKVKESGGRLIIDHPDFEIIKGEGDGTIHVDRIVPVYKNIAGISQRRLREVLFTLTEGLDVGSISTEFDVDKSYPRCDAYKEVHFPEFLEQANAARRYFALEEFFKLQLKVAWRRSKHDCKKGVVQGKEAKLLREFYENLPFDLTDAQKRSVKEVAKDMRSSRAMNRLLQGDVGSGKTFVAMCAILLAVESGNQAALMAPTQILAEQHYLTFKKWLDPLGVRISLRTGSRKEDAHLELEGEPQVVVGTHALLYDGVEFEKLSLVVIDEQHKFGVVQRGRLIEQGVSPDVLVMTATPIPRTLTMTVYGDLDVSIIDELPKGRGKIITALRTKPKVRDVTSFLKEQLEQDRQAYIVYPLVDESESIQADSAVAEYEKWGQRLKHFEVGLLHGKIPSDEKESMMRRFRSNEVQVLVSTTVIEVGVDVPNANIMIIYNAERFGLAQLHQLRGRIGRGEHKSYCILVSEGKNVEALEKLQVLVDTIDGFKIAEEDLRLRGPGDVLGVAQSGLSDLKFIEYLADTALIKEARELADGLLVKDPDLTGYPRLYELVHADEYQPIQS